MSVIGSNILAGASGQGGYFIDRSLRLRSSASAYLSRTFGTPTNSAKWTFSRWLKRGAIGARQSLFAAGSSGSSYANIEFKSDDTIQFLSENSSLQFQLVTTQVFRDPSAWYNIHIIYDSANATSTDRIQLWVNGVRVTAFSTATYPSSPNNLFNTAIAHQIGVLGYGSVAYFDGYMTEINFIDGQALDPTYFGEYNEDTGVWQPIKYTGTYGTNGFYLNFSDNTSTTTLGYDYSGNSNNWTANNVSVTSGTTYDSMTDVPTLTSEDAANYATLNPLDKYSSTIGTSEANLKLISTSGGAYQQIRNTFGMSSGKWYMEWVLVSQGTAGRTGASLVKSNSPLSGAAGSDLYSWVYHATGSAYFNNTTIALSTGALALGDLVMYAFDVDTGSFWMGKNGTWANSGNPTTGANPLYTGLTADAFFFGGWAYNTSDVVAMNFGQRPFAYTPPTGFKSLNTYNLPDSTVEDGSEYFNTVLATGNASTQSITGVGFQPDFVWLKVRSAAVNHISYDAVRGADNYLVPNLTNAEGSGGGQGLTSFDTDGFTLGNINPNSSGSYTFVAWNWKANGSGVSNTDGIITSTVSANTTAGFSIVSWTNQGTNTDTVGHGLGVAPKIYISKKASTTGDWFVFYSFVDGSHDYLLLNSSQAAVNHSIALPTSTVFTTGAGNTDRYITYCFAEVEGFSKFGFYTGNGSANGPFSYLGFRPAFVMIKSTGVGTRWIIWDAARDTYNVADKTLAPNFNAEEFVNPPYWYVDLLSNGFKVRGYQSGDTENNYPGSTYIYMAFAENPFKNALAR